MPERPYKLISTRAQAGCSGEHSKNTVLNFIYKVNTALTCNSLIAKCEFDIWLFACINCSSAHIDSMNRAQRGIAGIAEDVLHFFSFWKGIAHIHPVGHVALGVVWEVGGVVYLLHLAVVIGIVDGIFCGCAGKLNRIMALPGGVSYPAIREGEAEEAKRGEQ